MNAYNDAVDAHHGGVEVQKGAQRACRPVVADIPFPRGGDKGGEEKILKIFYFLFFYFFVPYSTLFHLPPLRFRCADGCWDRTQDRCNRCIDSQTL